MGLTFSRKIAVLCCAAVTLCAPGFPAHAVAPGILPPATLVHPCTSEESKLEVIALKHLTSEQAVNLLKPLLDKEGAISGMNNQLVVRTTPANLEHIKQALTALDVAPQRLMITVKQDVSSSRERSAADVSGHIRSGKVVTTVGRDDPREQADVELRISRTDTLRDDRNTQQLQVLEGTAAYIEIGESVPVAEPGLILAPQPIVYNSISYKDLTTGFSVLPRIHGDEVTVEIAPHRAVLSREGGGKIDVQASHTTVSGKLGEWLDLGGAVQRQSSAEGGIVYSTRGLSSEQHRVLIKVEKLDVRP